MKQAIDEGFIIDVLKNYTTYETYWKLHQVKEDDPLVEEGKAKAILRKFVREHPSTIKEKTAIMMDPFLESRRDKLMVRQGDDCYSSSKLAVEYRLAVDKWIEGKWCQFQGPSSLYRHN